MRYQEVKAASQGKWDAILRDLVPSIAHALDKPGHKVKVDFGSGDKFRVFKDVNETGGSVQDPNHFNPDGFATAVYASGKEFDVVWREIRQWHLRNGYQPLDSDKPLRSTYRKPSDAEMKQARKAREAHRRVFDEAVPADRPQAKILRNYLESRGLTNPVIPESIRLHRGMKYYDEDGNFQGTYPAMVSAVTDTKGNIHNVHRTYLKPDGTGKAPVEEPKKLMLSDKVRNATGYAVHLAKAGEILAVTEGIETGFAVMEAMNVPVWSCISAPIMPKLVLPEIVKEVWVFADLDPVKIDGMTTGTGLHAATQLSHNLSCMGVRCHILVPPGPLPLVDGKPKGVDWLDELIAHGDARFPEMCRRLS